MPSGIPKWQDDFFPLAKVSDCFLLPAHFPPPFFLLTPLCLLLIGTISSLAVRLDSCPLAML